MSKPNPGLGRRIPVAIVAQSSIVEIVEALTWTATIGAIAGADVGFAVLDLGLFLFGLSPGLD